MGSTRRSALQALTEEYWRARSWLRHPEQHRVHTLEVGRACLLTISRARCNLGRAAAETVIAFPLPWREPNPKNKEKEHPHERNDQPS